MSAKKRINIYGLNPSADHHITSNTAPAEKKKRYSTMVSEKIIS